MRNYVSWITLKREIRVFSVRTHNQPNSHISIQLWRQVNILSLRVSVYKGPYYVSWQDGIRQNFVSSYLFLFTLKVFSIPETIGRRMIKMVNNEYNRKWKKRSWLKKACWRWIYLFICICIYNLFYFFTVHFNSLNVTHQLMLFQYNNILV